MVSFEIDIAMRYPLNFTAFIQCQTGVARLQTSRVSPPPPSAVSISFTRGSFSWSWGGTHGATYGGDRAAVAAAAAPGPHPHRFGRQTDKRTDEDNRHRVKLPLYQRAFEK